MALSVKDGNQTATTLSSVVTGGEHIVAHTVVSLGSTAISNIASAVSGANVTVAGTVTANGGDFSTTDGNSTPPSRAVQIGWWNGADEYSHVRPSSPFPIGIVGRYGSDSQISNGQLLGVQKTSNYYGTSWDRYVLEVANVNSVTIGNSITIGSLPAISGTVTARLQDASGIGLTSTTVGSISRLNVTLASAITTGGALPPVVNVYGGSDSGTVRAVAVDSSGRSVVTVSNFPATQPVSLASLPSLASGTNIIGSVTASISNFPATQTVTFTAITGSTTILGTPSITFGLITGSVTANAGSGSFTVAQSTATNLKAQAETYQGGTAVGSGNPLQVTLANTTTNTNAILVTNRGSTGESTVSTFTSTSSATLKSSNVNRKVLTIYNEGAGNLHLLYGGGTATTANYSVKLFAGDYLEVDKYTGQVNAIFASAGTARITEIT